MSKINFIFFIFFRKDSLLKPQLMKDLSLPVGDSEGESDSSSEEMEEDQENQEASCPDEDETLETPPTSSWCTIL